jgi:hypothetical protein
MRHDVLELTFSGTTQTVKVKRGTLEVAPGHLSYVQFEDEQGGRNYVPLHRLSGWRYIDQSRTNQ